MLLENKMPEKIGKLKNKRDALWAEVKHRCRLNMEDIQMAKEMGLNPKNLIKNIPSEREQWKQPVKYWIREMYQEKKGKAAIKKQKNEQNAPQNPPIDLDKWQSNDDIPF